MQPLWEFSFETTILPEKYAVNLTYLYNRINFTNFCRAKQFTVSRSGGELFSRPRRSSLWTPLKSNVYTTLRLVDPKLTIFKNGKKERVIHSRKNPGLNFFFSSNINFYTLFNFSSILPSWAILPILPYGRDGPAVFYSKIIFS